MQSQISQSLRNLLDLLQVLESPNMRKLLSILALIWRKLLFLVTAVTFAVEPELQWVELS